MFSKRRPVSAKKSSSIDFGSKLFVEGDCLDLHASGLRDEDLNRLVVLLGVNHDSDGLDRFQRLKLNENKLTNNSAQSILKILRALPSLTSLDVSQNKFKGTPIPKALQSILSEKRNLARITYIANHPGPDGLDRLAKMFRDSPHLASLDFGWKCLTKETPFAPAASTPEEKCVLDSAFESCPSSSSSTSIGSDLSESGPTTDEARFASRFTGGIPAQCQIGRCKNAVVSPDRSYLSKFKGGNKYNANVQWIPTSSPDDESIFSYCVKITQTRKKEVSRMGPSRYGPDGER